MLFSSYSKTNIIFLLIIMFVFFYALCLPYLPITFESSCKGLPSIYCKSEGLTRAFHQVITGNFKNALAYNKYSIRIFFFFVLQFFLRILVLFLEKKSKNPSNLIMLDVLISILTFIYSFYRLLPY
jgi:Protein of unknown function (DUF2752)